MNNNSSPVTLPSARTFKEYQAISDPSDIINANGHLHLQKAMKLCQFTPVREFGPKQPKFHFME